MFDTLSLTQTFAVLFAIYAGAAGIGLLTDSKSFAGVMDEFKNNAALAFIGGIAAFVMGATIVTLHNLWGSPLEIIVSLIGWVAFIEGIMLLAFRRAFMVLVTALTINEGFMKAYGVFSILLAALLAYMALI